MTHFIVAYALTLTLAKPLSPLGAAATTIALGAIKEFCLDSRSEFKDHAENILGASVAVVVLSF